MATVEYAMISGSTSTLPVPALRQRRFHRVRTVRLQRGLSLQEVAQRTGVDVRQLRLQEQETTDLRVSDLRRWQQVLEVPMSELVIESDSSLSMAVDQTALHELVQTAEQLQASGASLKIRRLAEMLKVQLRQFSCELPNDELPEAPEVRDQSAA